MKALSIRQPWAWSILHAGKNIENRNWATRFHGPILIHAGKKYDLEGHNYLVDMGFTVPSCLPMGGIVGQVTIVGCAKNHNSKWFCGPYGFMLENAVEKEFFPCKGQLGFFKVDYEE